MAKQENSIAFTLGVLLLVLGIIVLIAQVFTTLVSVFFLGLMLIIGGVLEIGHGISNHRGSLLFEILGGIINLLIGTSLVLFPAISAIGLTLLIAVSMIILGIYRIFISFGHISNRGWTALSGFLTALLGVLVIIGWPASGLYIIGLFIGVQLFASGVALMIAARQPFARIKKSSVTSNMSYASEVRRPSRR